MQKKNIQIPFPGQSTEKQTIPLKSAAEEISFDDYTVGFSSQT